jgi:hypothetical protein
MIAPPRRKKGPFVVTAAAVVFLGVLWYAAVSGWLPFLGGAVYVPFSEEGVSRVSGAEAAEYLPSGRLFLSVTPEGSNRAYPYTFNLQTGEILRGDRDNMQLSLQHSISPNNQWIAFLGISATAFEVAPTGAPERSLQVFVYPYNPLTPLPEIGAALDASTKNTLRNKRTVSVWNDGRTLYAALPDDGEAPTGRPVNDWEVHVTHLNGWNAKVTDGIYPKWVSDTEFVVLKEDGIYRYNLVTDESVRIIGFPDGFAARANMKMALSPRTDFIAWSMPDESLVTAARLVYNERGALVSADPVGTIETIAFWPIFSEDGRVLALQELMEDGSGKVAFYESATLEKIDYEIALPDFVQTELFVTDWR